MVWIIIGRRTRTERLEGGLEVERECESCGERAVFYECKTVRTFRLHMIDVFDHETHRVMACGACGALYATDEHGSPEAKSAADWRRALSSAAEQVSGAVQKAGDALAPAWEQASENAKELYDEAKEGLLPLAKKAGEGVEDAFRRLRVEGDSLRELDRHERDEPESARERDPEKAALLRRFEALERRMKEKPDDEG